MTRAELVANLNGLFATYGVPVAPDPVTALLVPGVQVAAGTPYRTREQLCWTKTWDVTIIAGRYDDAAVYDMCDHLANILCELEGDGLANQGAQAPPAALAIGDVDYLAVTFTVRDFNL